jgi:hypothetical protein
MKFLSIGMNDVLPKPFTKDSLLGMLEKHLLHLKQMQQMQEMAYSIPAPVKSQPLGVVRSESPNSCDQPDQLPSSSSIDDPLALDDPKLQFYDPDYQPIFGQTTNDSSTSFQPQVSASTVRKRRPASDRDPYQTNIPSSSVRGVAQAPGKRARYNTPPW